MCSDVCWSMAMATCIILYGGKVLWVESPALHPTHVVVLFHGFNFVDWWELLANCENFPLYGIHAYRQAISHLRNFVYQTFPIFSVQHWKAAGGPVNEAIQRCSQSEYQCYIMFYFHSCWLRADTHFIWAFIIPVILIILVNRQL